MEDRHVTTITCVVAICLTVFLMWTVVQVRGCNARDTEYREKVYSECLSSGKDPLACREMISR